MSNQTNLTKKVINAVTQGRGLRGYSVIIDVSNAGMIQWRQNYTGAPWNDIIDIADLKGEKGDKGDVAFRICGYYSATRTYIPGDIVSKNSKAWICILLSTGNDPEELASAYWTELRIVQTTSTEGDPT